MTPSRYLALCCTIFLLFFVVHIRGQLCSGVTRVGLSAGYFDSSGQLAVSPDTFADVFPPEPTPTFNGAAHCAWFIKPYELSNDDQGNITTVTLYVSVISLSSGGSLIIYDGDNMSAPILARVDGPTTTPPDMIESQSGPNLYVVLQTSAGSVNNIFGAYFQSGQCIKAPQLFTNPSGTISSGNGPNTLYHTQQDCGFLIRAKNLNETVTVTISYNTEDNYDFVYVNDGWNDSAPLVGILTGMGNFTLVSTTHVLWLHFQSDKSVDNLGFYATYTTSATQNCQGTTLLSELAGVFSDENSDENYANNVNCQWHVVTTPDIGFISIQFFRFDLAPGDYLTIYEGTNGAKGQQLAAFTGSTSPSVNYNGLELFIQFTTSATGPTAKGFAGNYFAGACLSTSLLQSLSGTITDGSGDAEYQNTLQCLWVVDLSYNSAVQNISFNFTMFDVEYRFDSVIVYDGATVNTPKLIDTSGKNRTGISGTTSGPVMVVEFITDFSNTAQGFTLQYNAQYFTSTSNSATTTIVAVVVPVVGVIILAVLALIAFIVWLVITHARPRKRRLIPPNYSHLLASKTIYPLLWSLSGATMLPYFPDNLDTKRWAELLLDTNFATSFIAGAKKSHVEVNMASLGRLILLAYAYEGKHLKLLQYEVRRELILSESRTIFREDTAATTMFKMFVKIEAMPYIWKTFADVLHDVQDLANGNASKIQGSTSSDFEMDPRKLTQADDQILNALRLELVAQKLLLVIVQSHPYFPPPLRKFCRFLRQQIKKIYPKRAEEMYYITVGNFLFLRLFGVVIVEPHEWGIFSEPPREATMRILILLSKVMQSIATGSTFKEEHMQKMDDLIANNQDQIKKFYDSVSAHEKKAQKHASPPDMGELLSTFDEGSHGSDIESSTSAITENGIGGANINVLYMGKRTTKLTRKKILRVLLSIALNVVPDIASAILENVEDAAKAKKLRAHFREVLEEVAPDYNYRWDGSEIKVGLEPLLGMSSGGSSSSNRDKLVRLREGLEDTSDLEEGASDDDKYEKVAEKRQQQQQQQDPLTTVTKENERDSGSASDSSEDKEDHKE